MLSIHYMRKEILDVVAKYVEIDLKKGAVQKNVNIALLQFS